MSPTVRPLTRSDAVTARTLGNEFFGGNRPTDTPVAEDWPGTGRRGWGVEVDGRIVATGYLVEIGSWFGGCPVPTAGIAGVGVAAEHRGEGLLTPLVDAVLAAARDSGAMISTLYATAPGVYRRFGYETIASLTDLEIPTASLARLAPLPGAAVRRAELADVPAIREVYDAWAAARNGPLTRRAASDTGTDEELLAEWDGVSVAVDDAGAVVGYALWDRRDGYSPAHSTVNVGEIIALTGPAHRALWRLLGGFATVTNTVALQSSDADVARLDLPAAAWTQVRQQPYGLAVLDVPGAFAARGLGPVDAELPFTVDGVGSFVLTARDGRGTCADAGDGGPVFTRRGLALAWAGAHPCGELRHAGLLSGPDADDAVWDAVLGGRRVHIRDYF